MKVAFHTLGCKVNQNDTQGLIALFQESGNEMVSFEVGADVYVINTCAVTKIGEQKSRQMIRKAIESNPQAIVVVTGCYAQTSPEEIAGIPGVNLVVGMADRLCIVKLVEQFKKEHRNLQNVGAINSITNWVNLPSNDSLDRTRAMLKIEDGCEEFCSYCIVPYARGKVRSMPPDQVLTEFASLVAKDYLEIVLTGIHLGQYGKDLGIKLTDLIQKILKINGNCRIRLGSLEPHDLKEDLLGTIINNPQVCQHLHIPLQSGSNRILKLMNRNYDLDFFADLLGRIRKSNPLIAVGTDLIVGFPGETEEEFESTCNFVLKQGFSRIHVFRFSPRQGTPAVELPGRVSKAIQAERSKRIQMLASRLGDEYARRFIGKSVEVLFEEQTVNGWTGLSGEYLRVETKTELNLKNRLKTLVVDKMVGNNLVGTLIFK